MSAGVRSDTGAAFIQVDGIDVVEFGANGLVSDPTFGADDVTGTSVPATSSELVPAGMWYTTMISGAATAQVFIGGGWVDYSSLSTTSSCFLFSDGTNARIENTTGSPVTYARRRVYP